MLLVFLSVFCVLCVECDAQERVATFVDDWERGAAFKHSGLNLEEMHRLGESSELWRMRARSEEQRLRSLRVIPPSVPTFTEVGFAKSKLPKEAYEEILSFWKQLKPREHVEQWKEDDIMVNHYRVPTMISHVTPEMKERIQVHLKPLLAKWSGRDDIIHTSTYGFRTYFKDAVLRMHPDRFGVLVISAIINVEQDLGEANEPWPLEIYDHAGNLHKVLMEPGDIVFYESAACNHGRPEPFKGNRFTNIFSHYYPTGHPDYPEANGWDEIVRTHRVKNGIDPDLKQ